jgi:hypothetical protein
MTKKLLFVGAVLLAVVFAAMAADAVTGKWTFEQPMMGRGGGAPGGGAPGGGAMPPRIVTLDLKASGATLTGTILQPMGGGRRGGGDAAPAAPPAPTPVEIKNGKVNGNSVSFEVERQGQNGTTVTKYEGTVSGSEMKLKITRPGFGGGDPTTTEVTAKKATT